jgi:hypothetical protein
MTIFETVILGVFSGVLAATVIFILKELWVKTLFPLYRKVKYQGADVSGSWGKEFQYENGVEATFSLNIVQGAHNLDGSMLFVYKSPERCFQVDYITSGEYWEGYVNISCRSKDRKKFSQGNLFLKLIENGKSLEGQFSYRNSIEDKVTTTPIRLDRN